MDGGYLRVKNWAKFQHYKHRAPTWIKLYQSILTDYQFQALPDQAKLHLILIWLFASNHDGMVPNQPNFLRRALGLRRAPNLKMLINQGFLVESASTALASCYQNARPEKSRVEKIREEGSTAFFKEFPKSPTSTHEQVERNRAIAGALANGNVSEAARIRGKA